MELRTAVVNRIPKELILVFARRYVAGKGIDAALDAAERLWFDKHILSTIDVLGEDVDTVEKAMENVALYDSLIEGIALRDFPKAGQPSVSMKPSAFTVVEKREDGKIVFDDELCNQNLEHVIAKADEHGIWPGLDMENKWWTQFTLDEYQGLWVPHPSLGAVEQTRLYRTGSDINEFKKGQRVRLCIGIYRESSDVAFSDKRKMKENMLEFADKLLEKGVYVEFATHDVGTILRFLKETVIAKGIMPDQYEVQNLLGVDKRGFQDGYVSGRLFHDKSLFPEVNSSLEAHQTHGGQLRFYVPFYEKEENMIAYGRRRLIESPDFWVYGLKSAPRVFLGR